MSVGSSSNNQEDNTVWSCSIRRTWGNGNDISVLSRDAISGASIKPLPHVSIEKVEFLDNSIVAYIRNTGPSEITIAQVDVNDRIHPEQ